MYSDAVTLVAQSPILKRSMAHMFFGRHAGGYLGTLERLVPRGVGGCKVERTKGSRELG